MNKFQKKSLLTVIVFILGVALGSYFRPIESFAIKIWENLHKESTNNIYFCPPPNIVKEHQYSPEAFEVEKLYWQMDYQGWKAPDSIGFMQALINKDNNLVCYYQWANPQDKGTNLWMTIHLSPDVNQEVKAYGSYWLYKQEEKQALCTSGIKACGFIMKESSRRIIPQE